MCFMRAYKKRRMELPKAVRFHSPSTEIVMSDDIKLRIFEISAAGHVQAACKVLRLRINKHIYIFDLGAYVALLTFILV